MAQVAYVRDLNLIMAPECPPLTHRGHALNEQLTG